MDKHENLIAFLSIIFSKPSYNRCGDLESLILAEITDEASELLGSSSSTSEQSGFVGDGIEALAEDVSKEKSYLSRAA